MSSRSAPSLLEKGSIATGYSPFRMKTAIQFTLLSLIVATASCGGFFRGDDDDDYDSHAELEDDDEDHHRPRHPRGCDASVVVPGPDAAQNPDASETPDAGVSADSGVAADAEAPDANQCETSPDCPVGSQCAAGSCVPCANGVCACARDENCPGDQICDHANAVCVDPIVRCAAVTSEAECNAREECLAVYGGTNCTDANGGECTSGDPDCTCETFSFVVCTDQPQ